MCSLGKLYFAYLFCYFCVEIPPPNIFCSILSIYSQLFLENCPVYTNVTIYTAGQLCTQHCDVNTHSRAHLPGCVRKLAPWLGLAWGWFSQIRFATGTLGPNLSYHILFVCITVVYASQTKCNLKQNLNFAGLCATRRVVFPTRLCAIWPDSALGLSNKNWSVQNTGEGMKIFYSDHIVLETEGNGDNLRVIHCFKAQSFMTK